MKRLILLRHGKAADHWEDFARPLSTKGKEEVRDVTNKLLGQKDILPEALICSEAARTKETYAIFSDLYSNAKLNTVYVQTLYHGSIKDVVETIGETDSDVSNLMVVGHNPVLSELASTLSRGHISLSTANAAVFTSKAETWDKVLSEEWTLETIVTPA